MPETDRETGNLYWYNQQTLETSWTPPPLARQLWQLRGLLELLRAKAAAAEAAAGPKLLALRVSMGGKLAVARACMLRVIAIVAMYTRSATHTCAQHSQWCAKEMWALTLAALVLAQKSAMDAVSAARAPVMECVAAVRTNTLGRASDFTLDFVETFSDPDLRVRIESEKAARVRAAKDEEARRLNAERWEAGESLSPSTHPSRPPSLLARVRAAKEEEARQLSAERWEAGKSESIEV